MQETIKRHKGHPRITQTSTLFTSPSKWELDWSHFTPPIGQCSHWLIDALQFNDSHFLKSLIKAMEIVASSKWGSIGVTSHHQLYNAHIDWLMRCSPIFSHFLKCLIIELLSKPWKLLLQWIKQLLSIESMSLEGRRKLVDELRALPFGVGVEEELRSGQILGQWEAEKPANGFAHCRCYIRHILLTHHHCHC